MAETDTLERATTAKVQVANLPPADGGRGFARLSLALMKSLSLNEGDVIEIVGKRSTTARTLRPYPDDAGLEIIRLDGLQRSNARVGSGDYVEVKKAQSKPATRVVFAPAQDNIRLQGSATALKRSFAGRPLVEGDVVATTGHQRIDSNLPEEVRASAARTSPTTTSAGCATRSTRCARWSNSRFVIRNCSSGLASIPRRAFSFTARPAPARPG